MKTILTILAALLLAPFAALAAAEAKPNFVLIFTDDQGYGDLGSFGSTTIRTPHHSPAQAARLFKVHRAMVSRLLAQNQIKPP